MDDGFSRIGRSFSHYRIVSKIGQGGMGEVYRAVDTKLDRQVAVKFLSEKFSSDSEKLTRFVQEAKAASALNHPNILTVFEIGNHDNSRYIATELIIGKTLRDHIAGEPLKLGEALDIALQVAAALCAAHDAGIIHRDVKPDNIMIRNDGLVKVLDFGLAKLSELSALEEGPVSSEDATKEQFSTEPGTIMGTFAYMSPEQARGRKLDARSDIFSLGIVMFELFTGKRPFAGESHLDLISSILKDETPSLRQVSPGLPRQLERIIDKTLRKDRDHRYQHVKDLYIDLEDLRDELKFEAKLNQTVEPTVGGTPQVTNAENFRSTFTTSIAATRRFTLLHAFLFAFVAAGLMGGFWYYYSNAALSRFVAGSFKISEVANWSSAPGEIFSNAAFSPDGKMIAFASTKSGTKNIWVTQTASTEAIQVTNDAFSNTDPIWSPKGDEIAFLSQRSSMSGGGTNSLGVWRVSALGGTPKYVGPLSDGSSKLRRWTPSGKIYYHVDDDLHFLDTASGASQQATSLGRKGLKVRWAGISEDEKSIAYTVLNEGSWTLFLSDLADISPVKVTEGAGEIKEIVWLPEMKRVFYSTLVDGVFQIFVNDIGSGESVRITSSETDSVVVDAAPDGESIIFSSAKEESNLWRVNVGDGQESPLARDLNSKLWPDVSPDNEKLAFQSVKNLSAGNHLMESSIVVKPLKSRADNDRPTLLAENGFLPAWSPDGSTLAFIRRNPNTDVEIFAVNPNGGGERRLTTGGIPIIGYSVSPYNHTQTKAFAWSPDSARIAYISERSGAQNVWTVGSRGDADEPLTANNDAGEKFYCPIWSADGKNLAYFSQRKNAGDGKQIRALNVVNVDTRNTARVFETPKTIRFIGWTADNGGLIVAEAENFSGLPPETILKRVEIDDGGETVLARLKNAYYYNIFLSDDRNQIAFAARNEDKDDIWVVSSTGGNARKLTANNDSGLYYSRLAWLHDGSAIVFGKQTRFSLLSIIDDIK